MSIRSVLPAVAAAALIWAAPALGQPTSSKSVTATGTGQARVHPKNRHSSSSIAAAVDAARKAAIASALSDAKEYAASYANAAGLTLGDITSVSDVQGGFYGPGPGVFFGRFGPNKYCGTLRQVTVRPAPGQRPVFKRVHRCFVPPFAFTTLTVTFSAS